MNKIIAFENVTRKGLVLIFEEKFALNGGLSLDKWWFSWQKLSEFIFIRSIK